MKQRITSLTADLGQVARGFLMGGADIIPGVSGGTVALILGIYQRLVTAISHFDLSFLECVSRRQWRSAAQHADLRFLVTLGCGIGTGILSLASLMHYLLEHQMTATYAVFFGLILSSSILVARMVKRWSISSMICLITAAVGAFIVVGLPALETPPEGNTYVFVCGTIAICAMILPGISGSFILLILGKYHEITGLLRGLLHGDFHVAALVTLAVFAAGCFVGLLGFAKVLRWLLSHFESPIMAFLCGLMIGSLHKIWPFESGLPQQFDGEFVLVVVLAVSGAAFVFLLDWLSRRGPETSASQ